MAATPFAAARATDAAEPIWVLSLPGRRFPQNPYLRLFCDAFAETPVRVVDLRSWRALLFRIDVVHVHFPEHYVSAQTLPRACLWVSLYAAYFLLAKFLGRRIVWTVHNVLPSQNRHPWLLGPWMRLFRTLVDAHVFLSQTSRAEFAERFPRHAEKPARVVAHGTYAVARPDSARQAAWRARVASDPTAFMVGFLGSIKRYKNIGALRMLPTALSNGRRVQVVIAGTPDHESRADLDAVVRDLGDRVTHLDGRLSDEDLDHLIQAVDVVFLPYVKGWNSGFAMLVLANRSRLLTSDLPMFQAIGAETGQSWLATYDHAEEVLPALDRIAGGSCEVGGDQRLERFLRANSFERAAVDHAEFYSTICGF